MTRDDAKHLLLTYRPGLGAPEDENVAAALRLVESDPELRDWYEGQKAFHAAMRSQLQALPVPSELRDRILAGNRKIVPLWQRPQWILAAAACLVLALGVAVLWQPRSPNEETLEGFRSRMVGFALRVYRMDIVTNDLTQVRQFLRTQGAPADYALTTGLQATPVKGGAKLSWQGNPVSMVCFDLPEKQILYMFVMDDQALPVQRRPGPNPVLRPVGGIMTAVWSRDGKVYLVAAPTDSASLQRLVGTGAGVG